MGFILPATVTTETSSDHHKMASGLHLIALLCLTSGLWIGADAIFESDPCCPSGWTQLGQRCYRFYRRALPWGYAERSCTYVGANLASIQSSKDHGLLRGFIRKAAGNRPVWLGGYDAPTEGVWLWSDGSKFAFRGWARREPNGRRRENCMEIYAGRNYVNDARCYYRRYYVCAKPMV